MMQCSASGIEVKIPNLARSHDVGTFVAGAEQAYSFRVMLFKTLYCVNLDSVACACACERIRVWHRKQRRHAKD